MTSSDVALASLRRSKRVHVVGSSGAGKTTFARELARLKQLEFIELDEIHHLPQWKERSRESFRQVLTERLDQAEQSADGWVIDGNYFSRASDIYDARVDCVVWLDFSKTATIRRLVWRSVRRVLGRHELWNGNRERLRNLLSLNPKNSVIAWSWTNFDRYRERHAQMAENDPTCRWVIFRSPRAVRIVLHGLTD